MDEARESDLPKAIKTGNSFIEVEEYRVGEGKKPWLKYESGLKDYKSSFYGLPHEDIQNSIDEIRREHEVYVMDVMGEGQVLRELEGLKGGLSVTLTDARDDEKKTYDKYHNIQMINGNIASFQSWNEISRYIMSNRIPGFDIILLRSVGGLDAGKLNTPKIQHLLVQRLWERLNPNGGILLFQYCLDYPTPIQSWLRELKKEGFEVVDNGTAFEICRKQDDKLRLPSVRLTSPINTQNIPEDTAKIISKDITPK